MSKRNQRKTEQARHNSSVYLGQEWDLPDLETAPLERLKTCVAAYHEAAETWKHRAGSAVLAVRAGKILSYMKGLFTAGQIVELDIPEDEARNLRAARRMYRLSELESVFACPNCSTRDINYLEPTSDEIVTCSVCGHSTAGIIYEDADGFLRRKTA